MNDKRECRYCLSDDNAENLIDPCCCEGSMQFVHQSCLEDWIKNGNRSIGTINNNNNIIFYLNCEICKTQMKYTKEFKNNIIKSFFKMIKTVFTNYKSFSFLCIHFKLMFGFHCSTLYCK